MQMRGGWTVGRGSEVCECSRRVVLVRMAGGVGKFCVQMCGCVVVRCVCVRVCSEDDLYCGQLKFSIGLMVGRRRVAF